MATSLVPRPVLVQPHRYDSQERLLTELISSAMAWPGKTVTMAGHFMLMYREPSHVLAPLIGSAIADDPEASPQEREYALVVGDFPELSFAMGLRLVAARRPEETRIALLVNDHQFQSFQRSHPAGGELQRIRRAYYETTPDLPAPLRQLAKGCGPLEDLLEPNHARREKTSSLPSRAFCFSEQVLQNRFSKHRKPWILQQPGFRYVSSEVYNVPPRVVYMLQDSVHNICLIDEKEGCGCSGVMLEFLLVLAEQGARHLVLFIPYECRDPVHASIEAMMACLRPFENVIAVWAEPTSPSGHVTFLSTTSYRIEGMISRDPRAGAEPLECGPGPV